MNTEKLSPIVKGMFKHMPGVKSLLPTRTGGTIKSRYCYAVWMRHLKKWSQFNSAVPKTVVELGPGDSLGIGLAALLTGTQKIYTIDVIRYWDVERNLQVFEELIQLFKSSATIPDNREYPKINPPLSDYSFPCSLLSQQDLEQTLHRDRLQAIRKELENIDNPNNTFIRFASPKEASEVIPSESTDLIFSQAVLEYIVDLGHCFQEMDSWLRPGGCTSHCIDLSSHGITPSWNGHWTFSELEWKLATGGKKVVINRLPYSAYVEQYRRVGFQILSQDLVPCEPLFSPEQMARRFRGLDQKDLTTRVAYILARK